MSIYKNRHIDLHVHTPHSDGDVPEEELIKIAEEERLAAIAFTDHDSVAVHEKLDKLRNKQKTDMKILSGIEITSLHKGGVIEVLGYNFDVNKIKKDFKEIDQQFFFDERYKRFLEILRGLGITIELTKEELDDASRPDKANIVYDHVINTPHYRSILKEINPDFVKKMSILRRQGFYNIDSPMFMDLRDIFTDAKDSIDIIKSSKGKAIMAHGGEYEDALFKRVMNDLGMKFDGYEVFHPANSTVMREDLTKLATINKKIITGGSDFHGKLKPNNKINCEKVPAALLKPLFDDKIG